jgi:hypothetical protein
VDRAYFNALRDKHYQKIVEINEAKGHDYAGEEDALANFKKDDERVRRIVDNDPTLAKWYIYFDKHYEAVMTFLEEGDVKSEPIEGRIHDAILYLFLLLGLLEEKRDTRGNRQQPLPAAERRPLDASVPFPHDR